MASMSVDDIENNLTPKNNNNQSKWKWGDENGSTTTTFITTTTSTDKENGSSKSEVKAIQFSGFGWSSNNNDKTSNDSPFKEAINTNNNGNNTAWSFGATSTTTDNNNNNNNNNNSTSNDSNSKNNDAKRWTFGAQSSNDQSTANTATTTMTTGGFSWSAPVRNDNNNDNSNNCNKEPVFKWGVSSSNKNDNHNTPSFGWNPTSATDTKCNNGNSKSNSAFSWQPKANDNDPFASFNANNKNNDNSEESDKQSAVPIIDTVSIIDTIPIIDDSAIDKEGQAAFLAKFAAENADQWSCAACCTYNPNDINICKACETPRNGGDLTITAPIKPQPAKQEVASLFASKDKPSQSGFTWDIKQDDQDENDMDENDMDENEMDYYKILSDNHELLEYDNASHPEPQYFPYKYDGMREELETEGPIDGEIFNQFDDDLDTDNDQEIKDNDKEENDDDEEDEAKQSNPYVKFYKEYKQKRSSFKQEIISWKQGHKIKGDDTIIAMAGDGSMSGQLGAGNGSVTNIPNNIASFPFMLKSLMGKKIKSIAAGIMSTAVVTTDDEIYAWGLNDKSELTIHPKNDPDVGDDDDELPPNIAWERLFQTYLQRITTIYQQKNPEKLKKPQFVENLLLKYKKIKISMKYGKKEQSESGFFTEEMVKKIKKNFEDLCQVKKDGKVKYCEEVIIYETAEAFQDLYKRVCIKNEISENQREELYIPKATEQEMKERKDRKLNPYKYLKLEGGNSSSSDTDNDNDDDDDDDNMINDKPSKPGLSKNDALINNKDIDDTESEYLYEQKKDKYEEDDFQSTVACSYWTPAHIRLPYRMKIKQVTLGGTHMVVLDDLGQVWSSGTFTNDGPVGHHFDELEKRIIRYQRTLKKISHIDSCDDGRQGGRLSKNRKLPSIQSIASGANHFLMLDNKQFIWTMGITKLGQRWCSRNSGKYLSPQRIFAKQKGSGKRAYFTKIACGNHHNLAIDNNGHLYSWGQNIWMQTGHKKDKCGYGNTIDQPRFVQFYEPKKDLQDIEEKDVCIQDYKLVDVVAGEHMTIALDINGNVWTCGRNACAALGRKTRDQGVKILNGRQVKSEVDPDVMRMVTHLTNIKIDWIGCGSVVWFAHNQKSGAVYSFGDASSGRAGIGKWRYARGRPVFDEYNLDINRFQVIGCQGGSDHVIFNIKRKQTLSRRHSVLPSSNSRELSPLDSTVVDGINNLQTNTNTNNNNNNNNNNIIHNENSNNSITSIKSNASSSSSSSSSSLTARPATRRRRKRRRSMINTLSEIAEDKMDQDIEHEPVKKRRKTTNKQNKQKPSLAIKYQTSPVPRSNKFRSPSKRNSSRKKKK